jgi:hypothetical protein
VFGPEAVIQLQRTAGNAATSRLLSRRRTSASASADASAAGSLQRSIKGQIKNFVGMGKKSRNTAPARPLSSAPIRPPRPSTAAPVGRGGGFTPGTTPNDAGSQSQFDDARMGSDSGEGGWDSNGGVLGDQASSEGKESEAEQGLSGSQSSSESSRSGGSRGGGLAGYNTMNARGVGSSEESKSDSSSEGGPANTPPQGGGLAGYTTFSGGLPGYNTMNGLGLGSSEESKSDSSSEGGPANIPPQGGGLTGYTTFGGGGLAGYNTMNAGSLDFSEDSKSDSSSEDAGPVGYAPLGGGLPGYAPTNQGGFEGYAPTNQGGFEGYAPTNQGGGLAGYGPANHGGGMPDEDEADDYLSQSESDESSEDEVSSEEAPVRQPEFQYGAKYKHVNAFQNGREYALNRGEQNDSTAALEAKIEASRRDVPGMEKWTKAQILLRGWGWSEADVWKHIDKADENKWKTAPKVEYLNAEDREQYRVTPGSPMKRGAAPFSTKNMSSNGQGAGFGIFVMSPSGEFFSNSHKVGLFHHTSFLEGMPTAGAGEWKVNDSGALVAINNKSGHYETGATQFAQVLKALERNKVNLSGVAIQMVGAGFKLGPVQKFEDDDSSSEEESNSGEDSGTESREAPAPVYYKDAAEWLHDPSTQFSISKQALPNTIVNKAGAEVSVDWFEKGIEFATAKGEHKDATASMNDRIRKIGDDPDKDLVGPLKKFGWSEEDISKYVKDGKWRQDSVPKVEFLNENDRQQYRVLPGSKMSRGKETFTTNDMTSNRSGSGFGIFVMSPEKEFYSNSHKVGLFHHTSFLEGMPTAGAGEWKVGSDGTLKVITNKSGHYQTSKYAFVETLRQLEALGVDLHAVEIKYLGFEIEHNLNRIGEDDKFLRDVGAKRW